jgi:hypothetical protein
MCEIKGKPRNLAIQSISTLLIIEQHSRPIEVKTPALQLRTTRFESLPG